MITAVLGGNDARIIIQRVNKRCFSRFGQFAVESACRHGQRERHRIRPEHRPAPVGHFDRVLGKRLVFIKFDGVVLGRGDIAVGRFGDRRRRALKILSAGGNKRRAVLKASVILLLNAYERVREQLHAHTAVCQRDDLCCLRRGSRQRRRAKQQAGKYRQDSLSIRIKCQVRHLLRILFPNFWF